MKVQVYSVHLINQTPDSREIGDLIRYDMEEEDKPKIKDVHPLIYSLYLWLRFSWVPRMEGKPVTTQCHLDLAESIMRQHNLDSEMHPCGPNQTH